MTDYVTPTTWEQCAAHVEAGGVVEIEDAPGVWINDRAATTIYRGRCRTPDDGWAPRRLVPIESAAAPVTGDDLRERIARAIWEDDERVKRDQLNDWRAEPLTDHEVYLRNADAVLAVLSPQPTPSPVPPWPGDDDWCGAVLNDLNSIIHQHCGSDGSDDAHCDWVNDLANEVVRYFQRPDVLPAPPPAPSPVPPWPGAVLSGLTDEDGVPTWLAQAGQVRGEQVRLRHLDDEWATWATLDGDEWVEVRAPRAVPAPETERVPWGEALIGRSVPGRPELVDYIRRTPDGIHRFGSLLGGGKWEQTASADGTVEVLARDGES